MTSSDRPFRTWLISELGCLGELLLWWYVVPCAVAFLYLVFLAGDLVVVSAWVTGVVLLAFVVAPLVVVFTAGFGYVRAKRRAQELLHEADDTGTSGRARESDEHR